MTAVVSSFRETEDATIVMAHRNNAGQLKQVQLLEPDRMAKYNQLLKIEEKELEWNAEYDLQRNRSYSIT